MAKVRKRGKSFVLDYRIGNKRPRLTLDSREEAEELCEKYNALKRARRTDEFAQLLAARQALIAADIQLTGKTLGESMLEYSKTCSSQKSYQTQKNEKSDFRGFFEFLRDEKEVHFLREVTPQMLEEYQGRLMKSVSPSTCNRRFNGFNNFFNKCVEWGYLDKSPARFIKHRKERPNPRKTFTDQEVIAVAGALTLRLRRPFLFSAIEGVRPGECGSPRVRDWNEAELTLVVYSGKGAESSRTLHLHPTANQIIAETLAERINVRTDDFIFLNARGKRLRPAVVTKAVRLARERLGIEKGKTPYGLRHTYATKLARLNVASEKAKRLMGHASSRTTEKYYKLEAQDLRETVSAVAKVFDFGTGKEIETVTNSHNVG